MDDQHSALVAQFADEGGNHAAIGISEANARKYGTYQGSTPDERLSKGNVQFLEDFSPDDGFVFVTKQGKPELWANPGYEDYDKMWNAFTQKYYGTEFRKVASGADWNIDHLFPKGAAELKDLKFVRLVAVDAKANQLMGCALEKQMIMRERENASLPADPNKSRRDPRPMVNATPFTLGKLSGFHETIKLPKNRNEATDVGVMQRLVARIEETCRLNDPPVMRRLFEVLTRIYATQHQTPMQKRDEKLDRLKKEASDIFGY